MSGTETVTKPKINTNLKKPGLFKVIYVNDDTTTMEFVVESLVVVFNHTREEAHDLTLEIHSEGSAVVAVLPFEMAEQKGLEATIMARNNGYPLSIKIEAE